MKNFDFLGQTILLFISVGLMITSVFDHGTVMFLMMLQFVVGCWQMFSATINLLFPSVLIKLRLIHFIMAILILLAFLFEQRFSTMTFIWMIIIPSWGLAFFYYYITLRSLMKADDKQSKFLPHLSF